MKTIPAILTSCAVILMSNITLAADPLWTTDWPAYVASQGARPMVRGVSPAPAPTESEAVASAEQNAAEAMALRLLAIAGGDDIAPDESTLRKIILDLFQTQSLIVDRHVQPVVKSYATVWTAQVLVDASPTTVKLIRNRVAHGRQRIQERWIVRVAGISVGVAGIFVLAFCVNAFTRGYFIGWVMVGALSLMAIATNAIWMLT